MDQIRRITAIFPVDKDGSYVNCQFFPNQAQDPGLTMRNQSILPIHST